MGIADLGFDIANFGFEAGPGAKGRSAMVLLLGLVLLLTPCLRAQYGHPGEPLYQAMELAFKALGDKDYPAAVKYLEQAARIAPKRPDVQKQLGYALVEAGRAGDAVAAFERAMELAPADHDYAAWMQLAYLYIGAGQGAKAKELLAAVAAVGDATYSPQAQSQLRLLADVAQAAPAAPSPSRPDQLRETGYRLQREGRLKEAIEAFAELQRVSPEDDSIALQLGYWTASTAPAEARKWFERASHSADTKVASQARTGLETVAREERQGRKQAAYKLKSSGDAGGAIRALERLAAEDAADYDAMLQLGYWTFEARDYQQAARWFRSAVASPDPVQSRKAAEALSGVNREIRRWFLSAYLSPYFTNRFNNFITTCQTKVGVKLGTPLRLEPYVGVRLGQDSRTRGGSVPRIFSDNSATVSAGLQLHPFTQYLGLYGEAGNSVSLLPSLPTDRGRSIPDYRGGLFYSRGWGATLADQPAGQGPRFREVYVDASFYSRFGDDLIGYMQYKEGFRLPHAGPLRAQLFAAAAVAKDSRSDYYNNIVEIGPGLRVAAPPLSSLQFYVEFLRGAYLTQGHRMRNPYRPNFNNVRIFFVYGKSF